MPFTVTMPKLSPTMDEGTIVKWHVAPNTFVEAGDVLMEVATDKATVEYNAIDSGWLRKILVPANKKAIVNQPIAIFTEEKTESIDGYKPQGATPQPKEEPIVAKKSAKGKAAEKIEMKQEKKGAALHQPAFVPEAPLTEYAFEWPSAEPTTHVRSSPLARKLAKEKGIDLSSVKGTGPGQRVVSRDLALAHSAGRVSFGQRELPEVAPGTYEEEELSPIRQVIGQRLQESKSFIPHFYVTQTVDAESLLSIKEQLANLDIKVTINDLLVRACALALKEHPNINSGFNSTTQNVIRFKTIDISVAVSVNGGLITPIIRHADYKNVGQISAEMRHLGKKAKEGKLEQHEYKGGSFTLSNLGMFGVSEFQAIINPPQAAILAVSGIQEVPVVKNGAIVPGKTMSLSLSADHRVIDGVAAAQFLKTLQKYIENAAVLLIS